ncbi:MAG: hypothetical protein COY40_02645 [Alphaproteobacteria bacterium CG_4_10_14_0_8_um_filter_53_9]|nr:MAG: hypothetical protein COY40_02645 [Alphaproteobacteria bacterium CG_4_10_14_0_8_um_filter_53_9]
MNPVNSFDEAVKQAATFYFHNGFKCFPVHGIREDGGCTCGSVNCNNPGKHPATRNGLRDAVGTWVEYQALLAGRKGLNIAIATGPDSGMWVLDVDGPEGEASLQALIAKHGPICDGSLLAGQSTGKGHHVIFKHPGRKVFSRVKKLGDGLDTRGDGGYIVAAPSRHHSGRVYEWQEGLISDAAGWLVDLVCGDVVVNSEPDFNDNGFSASLFDDKPEWTDADVQGMLAHLSPDMAYDDWIRVGMALHHGQFSMNVWESWSRGSRKFKKGECRTHWRSFSERAGGVTMGTLVDMAQVNGWVPEGSGVVEHVPVEGHPAEALLRRLMAPENAMIGTQAILSAPVLPATAPRMSGTVLLVDGEKLPGILGHTCKWVNSCAVKPQPVLTMMNVLAVAGAVFGRRYQGHTGIRTNLYMVGIAPTGSGKEHSRSCMKALLGLAGQNEMLGGDKIISAAGVATMLFKFPRRIIQLDEVGLFLQAIGHKNAGSYERMISMVLTELFSSSKTVWNGGHYADAKKETITIAAPHLCIYGTTTLSSYAGALKREAIASGELNRYLVLPGDARPELVMSPGLGKPPVLLVEEWRNLASVVNKMGGNLADQPEVLPEPVMVTVGDGEVAAWNAMRRDQERLAYELGEDMGPLWMRYAENAMKIALILAIARDPVAPVVLAEDLDVGRVIARGAVEYALQLAREHMVSGDFDKYCKKVEAKIRSTERCGLMRSHLLSYMKDYNVGKRELDNILSTLIEAGHIRVKENGSHMSPGPKPKIYVAIK